MRIDAKLFKSKSYYGFSLLNNYLYGILAKLTYGIRFFGKDINIHPSCKISKKCKINIFPKNKGYIRIGKNCKVLDYAIIETYGGFVEIGDDCSVNPFTILYGHGGLKIGNGVRIAAHCVIIPSNHNFNDINIPIRKQGHTDKGIEICDDVWIGANCTILDGIIIGKGSIVGAGSVVTRDIPEYSISVGIPARVIKKRGE